ncbi:polysaccharide lyase [Hyalangium minutum]|uniref:F5/8 type C domain protein n=1 Tax=Hyalangium minutum TaxID=394096 RepID=A0A085WN33_9BACT|nr:polysaccharide lyase [Hyalangium minutum]KFE69096.1 F5/8 type C domain protein [Hyalangium minutum]
MRLLLVSLAVLLVSGPASASVVWRGDFETGDRSQYSTSQMVSADRLQVVTSPVAEGRYALKATVKQGDNPINASGNRNEVVHWGNETEGTEYYYRWKVMFPTDYPSVRTWQLFTQWHHDGCCGSPPVEFYVYGDELRLRLTNGADVWTAPLVRGVWNEFVFHVKWSSNPAVGFIELWHNREKALAKRSLATMYAGTQNYLKLGLYRNNTITQTGVVYHDGFIQATQLADVLPPPETPDAGTPPVDAGTPAPDSGATPSSPAQEPGSGSGPAPESNSGDASGGVDRGSQTDAMSAGFGCSVAGSPLAVISLVSLIGGLSLRRRR